MKNAKALTRSLLTIPKAPLLLFSSLLAIALVVIAGAPALYQPFLTRFPSYSEYETHFYLGSFALIFTIFSVIAIFGKKVLAALNGGKNNTVALPRYGLIALAVLGVVFVWYWFTTIIHTQTFHTLFAVDEFRVNPLILGAVVAAGGMVAISQMQPSSNKQPKTYFLYYATSVALIIFISFTIGNLDLENYGYFAGPINDMLHGKYLLHNAPSQYGFLSILFLSKIFHVIPLSLFNLTIVNAAAATLGFILIGILVKSIFRSNLYSLIGIIGIILFNYIVPAPFHGNAPQVNFLRFGTWIIVALAIALEHYLENQQLKKIVRGTTHLLVGLSFFWVFDNGLYLVLGYLSYLAFESLSLSPLITVKKLLSTITPVVASIGLVALVITSAYYTRGIAIQWHQFTNLSLYYLRGFGLEPLGRSGWPWVVIATYLLTLTYFFTKKLFSPQMRLPRQDAIVSFILFYGIFQFVYFIGRSHLNNLHHIAVPFLICLLFLLDRINNYLRNAATVHHSYRWLVALCVTLFIVPPIHATVQQSLGYLKTHNVSAAYAAIQRKDALEAEKFDIIMGPGTIAELEKKYGDYLNKNGIALISLYDTWYLIALGMTNALESNNLYYYTEANDFKRLANTILDQKPRYVFIDTKPISKQRDAQMAIILNKLTNYYTVTDYVGPLAVYEYSS